ncbi:pyruvate, phosphate dikinase [bacterium]|nr:pyruvate, phosphate dikinase [bacterium]
MTNTWLYAFDKADSKNKDLLGGKGANLANMTQLGLPVPPGFTITTEACNDYNDHEQQFPEGLWQQVQEAVSRLNQELGREFGGTTDPLLFSVRSGAKFSMPGMMDTILNLGLNDQTCEVLAAKTGNPRFAKDSYRRLIQTFGDVAMGIHLGYFEEELIALRGDRADHEITADELDGLIEKYKGIFKKHAGIEFPQDVYEQLRIAIEAVFKSWMNPRAITYRRENSIADNLGTAVNVQTMVFGNMGDTSGTGVCFSRNPSTGEKKIYGEFLINAQGEDVVAGIRTPQDIDELHKVLPEVGKQLFETIEKLEKHFRDMQDIEFTVQEGRLWMLQTRNGKRTGMAAVNVAVDMFDEGLVKEAEAVMMVGPEHIEQLLHPQIDPTQAMPAALDSDGLPASPGAAVGMIVLDSNEAVKLFNESKERKLKEAKEKGKKGGHVKGDQLILVREETAPDDIDGMVVAQGILTARGGMTSHAAVVARGMGKPCVASAPSLKFTGGQVLIGGQKFSAGDWITIDGTTGTVYPGALKLRDPEFGGKVGRLLAWADGIRRLKVRTNADNPRDSRQAVEFGAEGIGLTRTEHMFFEPERLPHVQAMILSDTEEERRGHLAKIAGFQKQDFYGIFEAMDGKPVTIRLLDPPLHEFLPHSADEIDSMINEVLGKVTDAKRAELKGRIDGMREANPMLGFRGCRLGLVYPEINEMQVRAIISAAIEAKQNGIDARPEIMVPLIGNYRELALVETVLRRVAEETMAEYGQKIDYMFGTMIEIPRAAVTADEIANVAEFFSFGTNDLTQMGMGVSRDDAQKFLGKYVDMKIYPADPFNSLDQAGIGKLVSIACELGRQMRPDIKLGICGEHGGDPASIDFCHRVGLNYVSCSPYRVPVARLAAAQAQIRNG